MTAETRPSCRCCADSARCPCTRAVSESRRSSLRRFWAKRRKILVGKTVNKLRKQALPKVLQSRHQFGVKTAHRIAGQKASASLFQVLIYISQLVQQSFLWVFVLSSHHQFEFTVQVLDHRRRFFVGHEQIMASRYVLIFGGIEKLERRKHKWSFLFDLRKAQFSTLPSWYIFRSFRSPKLLVLGRSELVAALNQSSNENPAIFRGD